MDRLRRAFDRPRDFERNPCASAGARSAQPIPPAIAERLIPDNNDRSLYRVLKAFGSGRPGITRESDDYWVIRDDRRRVVGGATVRSIGPDHPVAVDVAVDPARQRQGLGTVLYGALEDAGIDMEAASAASLAHRTMTPLGYVFMRSRRRRTDPDAEAKISASANMCPGCGPLP